MGGTHLWSLCVNGEPSQSCRHLYEQPRHRLKVPFSVCTLSTNNLPFLFCFHKKKKRQLEIETAIFSTLTPGGHPAPSPTPTSLGDTNVPLETSAQETFVKMASAVLYTKWWQILPVSFHFVPTSHLLQGLCPVPTSGTVHILQTTSSDWISFSSFVHHTPEYFPKQWELPSGEWPQTLSVVSNYLPSFH